MKIRIGHLSTFYHTAILLMAEGTVEQQLGIEAEWKLFGTGPAIVNAFERGELDLAYIGLPPAIIGIARGVAIKCVAGGHVEGTVISGKSRYKGFPEINDPGDMLKQFRGLKIGVPGRGSIHDVILTDCLEKYDLKKDIEVINYAWADQVMEAMVRNNISAAVGTPALAVAIKRYADGEVLYPPSRLWPNNPSYGILVHNAFLDDESTIVENFLKVHEAATAFLRNRPQDAARIISDYVGFIDEEFVLDTLKVSPKYCAQLTGAYIASTMEFAGAQRKLGYISREIAADKIFDTSIIKKIHPEKDHYGEGIKD